MKVERWIEINRMGQITLFKKKRVPSRGAVVFKATIIVPDAAFQPIVLKPVMVEIPASSLPPPIEPPVMAIGQIAAGN